MQNFIFQNPTKIYFGKGQIAALGSAVPSSVRNIMITYGKGSIKTNGVYDQVIAALREQRGDAAATSAVNIIEFCGIEPNPTYETLMQAVELARKNKVDFIIAVGGGSVADGTKFISAAINFRGDDAWDLLVKSATTRVSDAVPFACVLTLPGTGSEMNAGAVISRKTTGAKLVLHDHQLYPQFSILDPETTYSLPHIQTCNGIVDAFIHVIEQYLTYPLDAPLQDRIAEGLLLTFIEETPKVLRNPHDYVARANIMWSATLALNGLIAAGVVSDWATHMIGHELTAQYGLDHAQTLAIVLPSVMRTRKQVKRIKLLQYAERVWGINGAHKNSSSGNEGAGLDGEDARIEQAIVKTEEFFRALSMKIKLGECGIGEEAVNIIPQKLQQHGLVKLGEDGMITPALVATILRLSL